MHILVLNTGSTSLKASLYATEAGDTDTEPRAPLWTAHVAWTRPPAESVISLCARPTGEASCDTVTHRCLTTPAAALAEIVTSLWKGPTRVIPNAQAIDAVAHRVVFGGPTLHMPTQLTPEVRDCIARVAADAPTHDVIALAIIDGITDLLGDRQCQVAVFDNGFHATLAPAVYTYAVPYEWSTAGLRRYGFHGISHQYASARAAHLVGRALTRSRIVTVHLGGGASVAAILDGRSVDTSMGFTPMDGLVMATRSGAIDPGLLLHVLRQGTHSIDTLDRLLNYDAGIKGLSGLSDDMQVVVSAAHAGHARAQLAVDVYVHHAVQHIAAMASSMNGLDFLVFTAGVGEHAPDIREKICAKLEFLGVHLSEAENHAAAVEDRIVSAAGSRVPVLVIHAEENWMIAQECQRLLANTFSASGSSRFTEDQCY